MSSELVLASRWAAPENRRREALRAAHNQDEAVLGELLEYHLRLKSRQAGEVSPATLRGYRLALRALLQFCGPPESPRHALQTLEPEVIEAHLNALRARGLALTSVATQLYGLRALYRALKWSGAVQHDPAREVRAPLDPTPAHTRKQAIPPDRLKRLLALPAELHGEDARGRRDAALLMLGATKGGKARRVPLTRAGVAVLARWLSAREGLRPGLELPEAERALLVSFRPSRLGRRLSVRGLREIVNGYLAAAGLPSDMFGVHTLRRTAGTRLYRATRDLHVVSDILGHASVSTSAIYAKLDADIRREALEKVEDQE